MSDNKIIDTLVLSGGSVKAIATMGAILELEENGKLQHIKRYAGTSAGSIICALLNIEYTPQEIIDTFFNEKSKMIYDAFYKIPFNLYYYGLFSGNGITKLIKTLFKNRGFDENITFSELFNKTGKELVITGTCLNTRDTIYFNHLTFPDFSVINAIRISMSIPFFFKSIQVNIEGKEHVFVDGALLNNFPLYYFDVLDSTGKYIKCCSELKKKHNEECNKKCNKECKDECKDECSKEYDTFNVKNIYNCDSTIGIMILDQNTLADTDNYYNGFDIIKNLVSFTESLLNTMITKIDESNFINPMTGFKNNFFNRVIAIPIPIKVGLFDFDMSDETKEILVASGRETTRKFLDLE
jgi:NTE family protein